MIYIYVGLPGTGKTFSLSYDAYPIIKEGAKVISNYPVQWGQTNTKECKKDPTVKPLYKYKALCLNPVDFMDALKYENNTTFLCNEINIVFSSYQDLKSLDKGLLNRFAQGRHHNNNFLGTSQRFHHSLKRLRDLTNVVVECKKLNVFTFTVFRNIYYNPEIFDREMLFGTPLEQNYIFKKRFILPWEVKKIYNIFDTNFDVMSASEWVERNKPKRTEFVAMEL